MKNIIKTISLFLIIFCISTKVNCQTLSVSETIEYINEKLKINKPLIDQDGMVVWEISSDGKLIITRYWINKVSSTTTVYLKLLDENKVYIAPSGKYLNGQTRNDYIHVYTKDGENSVNYKTDEYSKNSSFLIIDFKDDPIVAKQLRNAVINLIKQSKQNPKYRKKDPFDD